MKRNLLWVAIGCGAVTIALLAIRPWRLPPNEALVDADRGSEDGVRGLSLPDVEGSEADKPLEPLPLSPHDEAMLAEANAKYAQMMELDRQNLKEEARQLAEEVLAVRQQILGEQHLDYALIANYLAQEYAKSGDDAQAAPLYENAQVAVASIVDQLETGLSQSQQIRLRGSMQFIQDNYLGFLFRTGGDPRHAYEAVLHWKGAILVRQRAARLAAESGKAAKILRDVQKAVHEYTTVATAPTDEENAEEDAERQAQRDLLALQKESLEGRLDQEGASILKQTSELRVDDIQSALPENAVLIDYSVRWFSEPSEDNPGAVTRRQALIAFVIRRGAPVAMYDLGAVEPIYSAIETWRATRGSSPVAKKAGVLLRERLWAPIEMAIGNARIALISPDGALGKFPFAALPGARPDTYLIEDLAVAVIPVPLLIPHLMDSAPTGELRRHMLVVGGVDYDHRPIAEGTMIAASPPVPTLPWEHRGGTPTLAGEFPPWEKKRGMAREATYIAGMYRQFMQLPDNSDKIIHLHDAEATEEAFCQMAPECKLLHLATHGYFVAGRGLGPGHTSGLVMGGANLPRPIPGDGDLSKMPGDGYLTAEEISFLSLGGTQLVVLSACDSGLGEIALGEGALGIQRAFQVAGARATIATLWKVHDGATRQIMEEFYTHYLQPDPQLHLSPLEALRAAQLWALYNPYEVFRGADPPPDAGTARRLPPEYWAAFTLSGDWR